MLYVTEYEATIPIYLMSYLLDDWDLESIKESQVSDESMKEIEIRNKIMLNNSVNNAKYVAYKEANKEINISSKKHQVIGTITDTNLKIGDEIIKINNSKIDNLDDIKAIITNSNIGDEFLLILKNFTIHIYIPNQISIKINLFNDFWIFNCAASASPYLSTITIIFYNRKQ